MMRRAQASAASCAASGAGWHVKILRREGVSPTPLASKGPWMSNDLTLSRRSCPPPGACDSSRESDSE